LPLSDIEKEIIDAIKRDPYIKLHDLSVRLEYSEGQIKRGIAKLKERGILSRVGAKQSSKWEIHD